MTAHRSGALALALLLSLLAAACGSSSAGENGEPAGPPTTATTAAPTTTTVPPRVLPGADAAGLPLGGPVDPGTYTTDLMGTEVGLTLESSWFAPIDEPGAFVIDPGVDLITLAREAVGRSLTNRECELHLGANCAAWEARE